MAAFADTAFAKDTALSSLAFAFGIATAPPPPPPTGPEGGISGYLKREKMYYRGANLMLEPMSESTRRAERIMAGWRDEEEAMMLVQIIETFYD